MPFGTNGRFGRQDPLSMGFFRQKYWNKLPFPPPEDLPDPGIEPVSPELQLDFLIFHDLNSPRHCPDSLLAQMKGRGKENNSQGSAGDY